MRRRRCRPIRRKPRQTGSSVSPGCRPDRAWQAGVGIADGMLPIGFDALPLATRRDVYLRLRARRAVMPDIELEALAMRQRHA